jgi:hypothetical protein
VDVTGPVTGREILAFVLWFAACLALMGCAANRFARWRERTAPPPPPPVNRKRNNKE